MVQDVDHNHVVETPVVQDCSCRHDQFGLRGATADADDVARHATRRADRHIAGELNQDALTLLRNAIVDRRRQIEPIRPYPWWLPMRTGTLVPVRGRCRKRQQARQQHRKRPGVRTRNHSKLATSLSMSD